MELVVLINYASDELIAIVSECFQQRGS